MDGPCALRGASLCRITEGELRGVNGHQHKVGWVCEEAWDSNSKWEDASIVRGLFNSQSELAEGRVRGAAATEPLRITGDQRRSVRTAAMASSHHVWLALCFLSLSADAGTFGRVVLLSRLPETADETSGSTLRTDASTRRRCAELAAPWVENTQDAPEENATTLRFRLRPFSPKASQGQGLVFPGKLLFGLVRQVYHCCQDGPHCRSVKGIPGRLTGDTDVEFLLTKESLSLTVTRVELHLQFTNPQHLDIRPMLPFMAKRNLPSRYSLWSRGDTAELRVDLLYLLQSLQEAAGGGVRGGPNLMNLRRLVFSSSGSPLGEQAALRDTDSDVGGDGFDSTDLGLVLSCSQAGSCLSCRTGGVHLLHIPFLALYYR